MRSFSTGPLISVFLNQPKRLTRKVHCTAQDEVCIPFQCVSESCLRCGGNKPLGNLRLKPTFLLCEAVG